MRLKKCKKINRGKRNCREEEKEECEKMYWQQKELVKHLIRKELGKHEKTLRKEIIEANNSGIKMWTMINKLKGTKREEMKTYQCFQYLFRIEGTPLAKIFSRHKIRKKWSPRSSVGIKISQK